MLRIVVWIVALALAGALAGCGGADGDESTTAAESTPSPSSDGSETPDSEQPGDDPADGDEPTSAGSDALPGASTETVTGDGTGQGTALLTRLALGRHADFDRVVLEFRDHVPGYRIGYVSAPVIEDGSGQEVSVEGDAIVEIRLEPASSYDLEAQQQTFSPRRVEGAGAGTSVVREAVRSGDFEAVLTWAVGLGDRVDYRVSTLREPPRLVVDFRNR